MNTHRDKVSQRYGSQPREELLEQPKRSEVNGADEGAHDTKLDRLDNHRAKDASLRRLNRYLIGLLVVATISVFSVVRQAGFVHWDDGVNIEHNPHIRGITGQSLQWMFMDVSYVPRYMPLGWLALAVDYELAGEFNPLTYHLGNLLLHCLNGVLVFVLLKSLLTSAANSSGKRWDPYGLLAAAGIGAFFWSIHPLRAEPVAWASARIYCVASFFAFCALVCYLRHAAAGGGTRWLWLSAAAFLASVFTYPIALGIVPVLVVMDFYPLRRIEFSQNGLFGPRARRVWLEKLPFVLSGIAIAGVTLWARTGTAQWVKPVTLNDFGIIARAMQAFYVWAAYLWKTWLPLELTPMYTALISFEPWSRVFVFSSLLVLGLTTLALVRCRRWKGFTALWCCYLALLVPMLGLTEHPHHANDRYSYIPGVIWSFVIATLLLHTWHRRERAWVLGGCGVLLVTCGVMTFRQASHWRNRETLLTHITSTLPTHPLRAPQDVQLGFVYRLRGETDRAIAQYHRALEADPTNDEAHSSLADVLSEKGVHGQAIVHYREALRLKGDAHKVRENFGVTLGSAGQFAEAAAEFEHVIRAQPANANAHRNLALTLARLGRKDEAIALLAKANELRGTP